jgi:hypothetical protein
MTGDDGQKKQQAGQGPRKRRRSLAVSHAALLDPRTAERCVSTCNTQLLRRKFLPCPGKPRRRRASLGLVFLSLTTLTLKGIDLGEDGGRDRDRNA